MINLTLATRESQLALTQANIIKDLLEQQHAQLTVKLQGITTKGDKIQDRPLADIGGKGLFLKELQQALLAGKADIAVHSAKDVPVEDTPGLAFVAVAERQDPRDVLVSTNNGKFADLPHGAIVGTSSFRRRAQLLLHRPDLLIKDLRGNVGTRLRKLAAGDYDAIVLAAAGLIRLQQDNVISEYLSTDFMVPSVAQGALMIEARSDDYATHKLLKCLHQPKVAQQITAERAFTKTLHGNCHSPIGVYAEYKGNKLELTGLVLSLDGQKSIRAKKIGKASEAEQLGVTLAEYLLQLGADKLLREHG